MQDEYDRIYQSKTRKQDDEDEYDRIYQSKTRKQDDEDEYDAIYKSAAVKPAAPASKPNTLEKTWENLKGLAMNPAELILSPLRDLKTNFSPVQGTKYRPSDRFGAPGGAFDRLPDGTIITKENTPNSVTAEEAKAAGINTGINAVTGSIPGLGKVGQRLVAAGTGAYYDKEDRLAGALTGLIAGEVVPKVASLATRATGALANRATRGIGDMRATAKGEAAIAEMLGGLKSEVGPVGRRKGPQAVQAILDAQIDAGAVAPKSSGNPKSGIGRLTPDDVRARAEAKQRAIDEMLIQEEAARVAATERISQGLSESTVRPGAARAPVAGGQFPDGYLASRDAPSPEVVMIPGQKKPIIDPEVKASRVEGEKLDIAEQRDAESRMSKEARALDKEAADAEAQAVKDAEKAAKDSDKAQKAAENTLKAQQAKAAREAEKAANLAEKAAVAAAKAAKRQSDAAALTAAQAVGKDAVKEVRARQAAEKAAQRAADAQAKADFATQAALDAQAKRQMADEAATLTVADVATAKPSTPEGVAPIETASGMLGVANARYNRTQRGKLAAQAALARRRGLPPTAVEQQVAPIVDSPASAPLQVLEPPVIATESLVAPQNTPAIPEVPPAPVAASNSLTGQPGGQLGGEMPPTLPPADKPFLNWRRLGVDPSKPDVLSTNVASLVDQKMQDPAFIEKLNAMRGKTTFSAMNQAARNSQAILAIGADPKLIDPKKIGRLHDGQIHALGEVMQDNAAMLVAVSEEIHGGQLGPDDLKLAYEKKDMLEEALSNSLLLIQRERSGAGRTFGSLRQTATMTLSPAYWLVKAQQVMGDTPMTGPVQARILKLIQEATDACGGG